MSDLHDEIIEWRKHLAGETEKPQKVPSPDRSEMPHLGEFIGE